MTLQEHLIYIGACDEAIRWAGTRTAKEAWEQCDRADWLLWWAGATQRNTAQDIVRTACVCARAVLHLVPEGEDRPRLAIEAAESWVRGAASKMQVQEAAEGARAAEAAEGAAWAARAAARAAAWAAMAAVWAAWGAAKAGARAAEAAKAAAEAAEAAKAAAGACGNSNDIIRLHLVQPWIE